MKIELTKKHQEVIIKALDLYSRVLMGQFEAINSTLLWEGFYKMNPRSKENRDFESEMEKRDESLQLLEELKQINGFYVNESFGISSTVEPARIAYEMQKVISCHKSWGEAGKNPLTDERDWSTMVGVSYDMPLKITEEPLPKITKC